MLATFDVGDILVRIEEEHGCVRAESIAKLCQLVHDYVEPEAWEANGGDVARLMVVGTKMFARAPTRYHARIEWILGQISEGAPAGSAPSGAR